MSLKAYLKLVDWTGRQDPSRQTRTNPGRLPADPGTIGVQPGSLAGLCQEFPFAIPQGSRPGFVKVVLPASAAIQRHLATGRMTTGGVTIESNHNPSRTTGFGRKGGGHQPLCLTLEHSRTSRRPSVLPEDCSRRLRTSGFAGHARERVFREARSQIITISVPVHLSDDRVNRAISKGPCHHQSRSSPLAAPDGVPAHQLPKLSFVPDPTSPASLMWRDASGRRL